MMFRLLGLLLVIAVVHPVAAKPQLRWCLSSFPGFYGFNPKTKLPEGPSVSYLQELARRADFTLLPSEETPASRCFAQMKAGEADLMINILKPAQSRSHIHYIQYAMRWPDRVYHSSSSLLRLEVPSQLSPLTVVTVRNFKATAEIQTVLDHMKRRQLVQVESVLTALQMVAKGRVDAALLPPEQVIAVLKERPELAAQLKEVSFSEDLVKPQPIYIGLASHSYSDSLDKAIRLAIQSMQQDGSAEKMYEGKIIIDY